MPVLQPVSLDRQNMGMLAAEPFMASWKADGTRYMMLIMRDATFMVDRDNNVFVVRNMHFPLMGDARQVLNKTLLDGELVCVQWFLSRLHLG
jgi:mRNA-capping enzyme